MTMTKPKRSPNAKPWKGFASMSKAQRRHIASMGGKKVHELGIGHQFTHKEAVAAGRKGGAAGKKK
jgi:general stress protein YciG